MPIIDPTNSCRRKTTGIPIFTYLTPGCVSATKFLLKTCNAWKSWNRLAQKRCWSSKTPTTVFQSSFQTAMCLKPHKIIRNKRTWTFWGRKHMVLKLPLKKNKLLDNSWNCSEQKTTGHLRPQSIPWTFILNRPLVFFTNTFANRKHEAKDCPKGGVVSQVRKPFSFQRLFSFKPIPMSFACAF